MSGRGECLVLGPEGAGKTLLLKRLVELSTKQQSERRKANEGRIQTQETWKNTSESTSSPEPHPSNGIPHTIPTVGTYLEHLKISKTVSCTLREYGSSMAPLWNSAYKNSKMVIYVIDSGNCTQVSASTMLLLDALADKVLEKTPVLIFFNKTDSHSTMSLVELKSVMRIENIIEHASQNVSVLQGSCLSGEGLSDILKWITEQSQSNTPGSPSASSKH